MIRKMINLLSLTGLTGAAVALMCIPEIQTDLKYCLIWCVIILLSMAARLWLWKEDKRDAAAEDRDEKSRKFYDFPLY